MSKLLLVDGYSLLYRAYYSSPPLSTKAGLPTGALYGFIRMVIRLLDEQKPDYAVVALDPHGPTFRHDADATYKANRSETPDDLRQQQARVREMLDGFSISRYERQGFEADDVLGTLAARGAEQGQQVVVVTGDGDSLQLAASAVQILLTRKGVTDLDSYGPEQVMTRFGFRPGLLPDFKGLKGDTSDNIPGVPGIGDKTGMALIHKFGALEGIYEHLEEVTPPRIRELLRTHKEQAFHSRRQATIITDLPVEAEPEDFRYIPLDPERRKRAALMARELEFKSLITRFEKDLPVAGGEEHPQGGEEPAPEAPLSLFGVTWESSSKPEDALAFIQTQGNSPIAVASSEGGLWLAGPQSAHLITGDLTEVVPAAAEGASGPSADPIAPAQSSLDFGADAPVIVENSQGSWASVAQWLRSEAPKVAHDAKTLMGQLRGSGTDLRGLQADTLVMGYLVDPTRQQHPVAFLAEKFCDLGLPQPPVGDKKGKTGSLFGEPLSPLQQELIYSCEAANVAVLLPVAAALQTVVQEKQQQVVWEELERPLIRVLLEVEECGMLLDPVLLRELGTQLETDARRLEAEIWESAGEKFNIGSPRQLQVILYEKLGLEKGRTIKTGASTDVHTLEKLSEKHDIVRRILDYRGITKLKSTYVDALLTLMDPVTQRVHTTLNQTGAVSGRLSSTDPNLQNIPIRTEQGRLIRKAFVAPPGHVLLSADYSQIELRVLAHITGDLPLVEAFQHGEDVHTRTAAALFKVPVAAVDKEMRRKAKMTNYAIAYGVSGFGLAKQLGSGTSGEAAEFIKEYFETLPGVKQYMDDTLKLARERGYVETLMGRRRPLPEINIPRFQDRAAAERTAINHPIQGTAADIMKLAMLAVQHELQIRNMGTRMTMQVHDELVFEVPEPEVETVKELVAQLMAEVPAKRLGLKVPLVADVGMGMNWDTAKGSE